MKISFPIEQSSGKALECFMSYKGTTGWVLGVDAEVYHPSTGATIQKAIVRSIPVSGDMENLKDECQQVVTDVLSGNTDEAGIRFVRLFLAALARNPSTRNLSLANTETHGSRVYLSLISCKELFYVGYQGTDDDIVVY